MLIELQAGTLTLVVTPNHRMLAPREGDAAVGVDIDAGRLKMGDCVVCSVGGERCARQLTNVNVWPVSDDEYDVFEITFQPDEDVAVLQGPSEYFLTKGFKKKPNRRGL